MSYESIISRRLHYDYVNLGFSGNAKAEDSMIDYIAALPMSLFVFDYDHNAPTTEHLAKTHERTFCKIGEKNPTLPILLLPRPKLLLSEEEQMRRRIILTTYGNALKAGDHHVYYVDNSALTALCGGDGTVDGTHPTDFGFASMARAIGGAIERMLAE